MIPTIAVLVLTAALLAWMWIFELRLAHLLNYAEQLIDYAHGPALPHEQPDTEPMAALDLAGGLRTRRAQHSRIADPALARILADHEDTFRNWRAGLAGGEAR